MNKRLALLCLLATSLALFNVSCGDEEDDPGTAPAISTLAYDPATATAGQQVTVTGTFEFQDPEGDVDGMMVNITTPDGASQTIPGPDPQAAGHTAGTINFQLLLNPPTAGSYTCELWVTDKGGNASNRLTATIEAQ